MLDKNCLRAEVNKFNDYLNSKDEGERKSEGVKPVSGFVNYMNSVAIDLDKKLKNHQYLGSCALYPHIIF